MAATTTSVNMNFHHPDGGNTMTLAELLNLKEQGMRVAATRALEDGYVVTIKLSNEELDQKVELSFDGRDQIMTMNDFFDILDGAEHESPK